MKTAKFKTAVNKMIELFGYKIIPIEREIPKDMDREFEYIYQKCKKYTMTPLARMYSLYKAVEYVVKAKIPGDFVECGVWRGGSSMVIAYTLLQMKEVNRKIFLYDTFEGVTEPTEKDTLISNGKAAVDILADKNDPSSVHWVGCASLEEVKNNLSSTNYPNERVIYVKGKVEDTLSTKAHSQIALLRLDTDWYESTYYELKHLFHLLQDGGVLIIDDYGWWAGVKEATDQYFKEKDIKSLMSRTDEYGGILVIKQTGKLRF